MLSSIMQLVIYQELSIRELGTMSTGSIPRGEKPRWPPTIWMSAKFGPGIVKPFVKDPVDAVQTVHVASCVSAGTGTSEELHSNKYNDRNTLTLLLMLADGDQEWDHSECKGDIQLQTPGLAMPLYSGDMLFFQSAVLPHKVI
jgi:hypothetical protein